MAAPVFKFVPLLEQRCKTPVCWSIIASRCTSKTNTFLLYFTLKGN